MSVDRPSEQPSDQPGDQPVIERALVTPGHDGAAELVVFLRFPSGAADSVVLDAEASARLMARCAADSVEALAGADWRHLMHVLG